MNPEKRPSFTIILNELQTIYTKLVIKNDNNISNINSTNQYPENEYFYSP